MADSILIVDDDPSICEILEYNLKSEGYEVLVANSADEALKILSEKTQLILLDVMMGGMSGFKLLEKLRADGCMIPVIFLTAKDTENDMLTGFSVGADDFITKPFSIKEVVARIKAMLKRRRHDVGVNRIVVYDKLKIDRTNKEVYIEDKLISLTRTEYEILIKLSDYPNKTFSRQQIIESVWDDEVYVSERTVDVHIARLRKKMNVYGSLISNRLGFGYKFDIHKL
ncbi:MAG TPA: response regulator transcription factor [Saprospiraceae bacterium]|nr:response regulator transcription factor [Saprospiraceae bacterium]HRO07940.1 response regulator transcription factor [Saprospiraceae bacterium]HRP41435.1 response regulator transcription factor [Saprospiraceae bacterium]